MSTGSAQAQAGRRMRGGGEESQSWQDVARSRGLRLRRRYTKLPVPPTAAVCIRCLDGTRGSWGVGEKNLGRDLTGEAGWGKLLERNGVD